MAFAPFYCSLGDSPEVELPAGTEVDISPGDDTVDSNRIRVTGAGTVQSLGLARDGLIGEAGEKQTVTKRIAWLPSGAGILLKHNPPQLKLLGNVDRQITAPAFGYYASDNAGNWQEEDFTQGQVSPTKGGGGLLAMVNYAASATITIPPDATRAWIRMWGASGASGNGLWAFPDIWCSAGVGSGSYLEKYLTGLTPGNTLIFTRGAAGVVNATTGNGGNGGDSILASGTQTITTLTAGGSLGTPGKGDGSYVPGSKGGVASGGDINRTGQSGTGAHDSFPGTGGAYMLSRGPDGSLRDTANTAGLPGINGGMIIFWFNDAVT